MVLSFQQVSQRIFRKYIALPADHGSWVFLLCPLSIGLFAGGSWSVSTLLLILAATTAFLVRQPVTILVKIYSHRRSRIDLFAAWFWTFIFSVIGCLALIGLVQAGYTYLLLLAIPGIPVFGWHLYLVSRRAERRQLGVEVVASGVLALSAPSALWVATGEPTAIGWGLWGLIWLQSAASIVYAYLRLEQRNLAAAPPLTTRIVLGRRALLYTTFNLSLVTALSISGILPPLIFLPYGLQWVETVWGTLRPAIGSKPTRIGIRQLVVSSLFTLSFILLWNL
jgi:hypothetical protein